MKEEKILLSQTLLTRYNRCSRNGNGRMTFWTSHSSTYFIV